MHEITDRLYHQFRPTIFNIVGLLKTLESMVAQASVRGFRQRAPEP
jgi:hypothetical protein